MKRPQRLHRVADVRRRTTEWRADGPLAFVPTMGALHAGHARLIRQARSECARVAVSIFVNPLQFDQLNDLHAYPRTVDADIDLCTELGVDLIFVPSVEELYERPPAVTVDPGHLAGHLCGAHRPGHFRGVATVVLKLFSIVQPDRAYFGEKDAQQLAIVRRMALDFDLPVTIVPVPTLREADGLALSSRNTRLSAHERQMAPALYHALREAHDLIGRGVTDPAEVRRAAAASIPLDPALRLEYLEIVDTTDMQPVGTVDGPVLIAGALWVGGTRLIDNVQFNPATAS